MIQFHRPCPGKISHPFGEQRNGYTHGGYDIINNENPAPIQAICDCIVVCANGDYLSGWSDSYGNRVWVEPIDAEIKAKYPFFVYAHLEKIYAKFGTFAAGSPIGLMGNTGNSKGRHLHLGASDKVTLGGKKIRIPEIEIMFTS